MTEITQKSCRDAACNVSFSLSSGMAQSETRGKPHLNGDRSHQVGAGSLFFSSQCFAVGADLDFLFLAGGFDHGFVGHQFVVFGKGLDVKNLA